MPPGESEDKQVEKPTASKEVDYGQKMVANFRLNMTQFFNHVVHQRDSSSYSHNTAGQNSEP